MNKNGTYVEINVNNLPEWYTPEQHDAPLEQYIQDAWNADRDREVAITYGNQGADIYTLYNDDGDIVESGQYKMDAAWAYTKGSV